METAAKDSEELQGKPELTEVNKLHPEKNKTEQVTQQKGPEKPKTTCYRCGAESHNSFEYVVSKMRIAENVVRGATSNESAVLAESIQR